MLLTFISTSHNLPLQVLSDWASSSDLELYQRLLRDFWNSQEPEQLVLILAALLCYESLLPRTSNDITQPISGCYLTDLGILLSGISLSNQRTLLDRVGFSFLRVLTALGDGYEDLIRLLAGALDKAPPILDLFDGLIDQYVVQRIKNKVPHLSALQEVIWRFRNMSLDIACPKDSCSMDHPIKSREDTRWMSDADTAGLGEESSLLDGDFEIIHCV